MSPLRLIVLAILFYIAYRLIFGGRKKEVSKSTSRSEGKDMPVSDVLEEDPICHRLVPRSQAQVVRVGESKYYFCSSECCDTFRKQQGEAQ